MNLLDVDSFDTVGLRDAAKFRREDMRQLTSPLLLISSGERLGVILPYAMYMQWQELYMKVMLRG